MMLQAGLIIGKWNWDARYYLASAADGSRHILMSLK
jgi:hypothetical protein